MANLNSPSIHTGHVTAADLEAARKHSTGTVRLLPAGCGQNRWPERRVNWPDTIPTDYSALDDCAPEGGKFTEPQPAMESLLRHQRVAANVKAAVAFVVMVAAIGYAVQVV